MKVNSPDLELKARAQKITMLVLDCDGVLTDGRLYFGASGEELKVFNVRDGQGLVDWHAAGFRSAIITGRSSPIVELRAKQLGVEFVLQGQNDKAAALRELVAMADVDASELAYIGDDTPDIAAMSLVGLACAVADAEANVRTAAHYVTQRKGGRGAVREVIDLLLESRESKQA